MSSLWYLEKYSEYFLTNIISGNILLVKVKIASNPYPGPEGYMILRFPEFLDNRHMKVATLSALRIGRLYPQKIPCYSFLLEAESTSGPSSGRKDYVNEKIQLTPSGIKPATFRLGAQCLNQLRQCVTFSIKVLLFILN